MRAYHPIHQLGSNPRWQLQFHGFFTVLWALSMFGVLFIPTFQGGRNFPALLIMQVSLWANFATHFGAMSAALSAIISEDKTLSDSDKASLVDL